MQAKCGDKDRKLRRGENSKRCARGDHAGRIDEKEFRVESEPTASPQRKASKNNSIRFQLAAQTLGPEIKAGLSLFFRTNRN